MNWKLKAHALAVLSRVPGGSQLYHSLQACLGTNALHADEYLSRALELVNLARECGEDVEGTTWLEVGTGWYPFVPFVLYLAGARRVVTIDVNPWLTYRSARDTYAVLADRLCVVAQALAINADQVVQRYRAVLPHTGSLANLLAATGIDYHSPRDARRSELPVATIDVVCSSNVLEHVPSDVLRAIHEESLRILKPGGVAVHRFNPADHYSSVDCRITSVNFLQFDEKTWRWYGSGLAHHNRLRCPQHQQLLREAGFDIRLSRVRIDPRALEALRRGTLTVHPDYRRFTPEDLAGEYMWLAGEKPGYQT